MILRQQSLAIATSPVELIQLIITLTTGTMFLIWLGEQITQYGLGNGISFIIFAGIVGRLPVSFAQTSVTSYGDLFGRAVLLEFFAHW